MTVLYRLIFLVILLNGFWANGIAQTRNDRVVELQWQLPKSELFEETPFIPSLYFQGAVFSDSLPQVPVFVYRVRNDVPHFVNTFSFDEQSIIQCSPDEIRILEEAGFEPDDFIFSEDIEYSGGQAYSRFHLIPVRKRDGTI
jgi:hypothetical protein